MCGGASSVVQTLNNRFRGGIDESLVRRNGPDCGRHFGSGIAPCGGAAGAVSNAIGHADADDHNAAVAAAQQKLAWLGARPNWGALSSNALFGIPEEK
jgi:hypothetical protein